MKKSFRILAAVLAAVLCLCLFTGCHGSKKRTGFETPESFDSSRSYEITFWAKNDTNETQKEIYRRAVEDFHSIYPNITVTIKFYTDYGRIYQDVLTNIATDTTPNVCITYPDHIATYMTGSDVVVPLDSLITDERYGLGGSEVRFDAPRANELVPEFLNECRIGESLYALPYMRSTEACYINKTLVEKLGYELPETLTWDFVWEVSEAAVKKDSGGNYLVNGQKVMIPFIYKSTDNMMISMLKQLNADYTTGAGEILLFNDTVKELLSTVAEHTKSGAFSTFKISSYPANYLNAGQCIFAVDSTAGATWMGTDAPLLDIPVDKVLQFETAVRPIPQFDPENPQMISQGPSVCIFNKEDKNEVLASWLFAQYLLTNSVQLAYSETEGYVPVTAKAQQSPEYLDYLSREGEDNTLHYDIKLQAAKLLLDNTENTFVTPVFNGSASVRDVAGQMIEETAKAVNRKKTVDDEFYETLFEEMTALKHLDQISYGSDGKVDLGPLPAASKGLLYTLGAVWLLIAFFYIRNTVKEKKKK